MITGSPQCVPSTNKIVETTGDFQLNKGEVVHTQTFALWKLSHNKERGEEVGWEQDHSLKTCQR